LTKRAAALAAINLNQFFKKGKHKYENQNERQGGRPSNVNFWGMKIKTNVKAGGSVGDIRVGNGG
jgi:hypothetical protein